MYNEWIHQIFNAINSNRLGRAKLMTRLLEALKDIVSILDSCNWKP